LIEKNGPYDIYFVDWKMPGMDGIELSRHIRKGSIEKHSDKSVVIMISAAEWTTIEEDARKAGVNKFLAKPLFPSSIADCINECLGVTSVQNGSSKAVDHFENYTMLLAEDVDINREIVLTLLEPTGLVIDCAENGAVALSMFSAAPEKYNIIFMDVQMPEMDGYEATRRIRAFEEERTRQSSGRPRVPIIAMTANVFREDVEKCLASGMNDHVGKPLDIEDMLTKLRKYVNQ
jgi:CheY-like chemotaxis protein